MNLIQVMSHAIAKWFKNDTQFFKYKFKFKNGSSFYSEHDSVTYTSFLSPSVESNTF